MAAYEITRCAELNELCERVRDMVRYKEFGACIEMLGKAMADYPGAPQPHNLLGIVLEKNGNHLGAMKHFRAAWALDPTYDPSSRNMERYSSFQPSMKDAYDECDCVAAKSRW